MKNLSAAAHLIHGSSEDRFTITYCPGINGLVKEEIESVGYEYECLEAMLERYNPNVLKEGWNVLEDGEEIYYISNPAAGLWAFQERFELSNAGESSGTTSINTTTCTDVRSSMDTTSACADVGIGNGGELFNLTLQGPSTRE